MRLGNPFLGVRISENRIFRLGYAVSNLYDAFKVVDKISLGQESNVLRQGQPQSLPPVLVPRSLRQCSLPQLQLVLQPVGRLCVLIWGINICTK